MQCLTPLWWPGQHDVHAKRSRLQVGEMPASTCSCHGHAAGPRLRLSQNRYHLLHPACIRLVFSSLLSHAASQALRYTFCSSPGKPLSLVGAVCLQVHHVHIPLHCPASRCGPWGSCHLLKARWPAVCRALGACNSSCVVTLHPSVRTTGVETPVKQVCRACKALPVTVPISSTPDEAPEKLTAEDVFSGLTGGNRGRRDRYKALRQRSQPLTGAGLC